MTSHNSHSPEWLVSSDCTFTLMDSKRIGGCLGRRERSRNIVGDQRDCSAASYASAAPWPAMGGCELQGNSIHLSVFFQMYCTGTMFQGFS